MGALFGLEAVSLPVSGGWCEFLTSAWCLPGGVIRVELNRRRVCV